MRICPHCGAEYSLEDGDVHYMDNGGVGGYMWVRYFICPYCRRRVIIESGHRDGEETKYILLACIAILLLIMWVRS